MMMDEKGGDLNPPTKSLNQNDQNLTYSQINYGCDFALLMFGPISS